MNLRTIVGTAALAFIGCCPPFDEDLPEPNGNGYGYGYGQGYGYGHGYGPPPLPAAPPPTAKAAPAIQVPLKQAAGAQPILRKLARQEAVAMVKDGPAVAAQFREGQIYEVPFQMQPGSCYMAIAASTHITELDLQLIMYRPLTTERSPAQEPFAAQDKTFGPNAVLGGSGNCFKNPVPMPVPAMLRVRATGGHGVALIQRYLR